MAMEHVGFADFQLESSSGGGWGGGGGLKGSVGVLNGFWAVGLEV